MNSKQVVIEVVYGTPHEQTLLKLDVPENSTVEEAIALSGILKRYPEVDLANTKVGVWNRVVKPSSTVKLGDRIEIYRPLIADPKEVRKRRAAKAVEEGRADKVTGGRPNRLKS